LYRAHTVSVAIAVDPQRTYDYASNPSNLPTWAPGFVHSIQQRGDHWVAQTTLGPALLRFAPTNGLGVLDHDVELPAGRFHNPMRVIPNGRGSEVLFTLLQLPGVTDEQFKGDLDTVRGDLQALKRELELRYGSAA
jgi:hypothetical protein